MKITRRILLLLMAVIMTFSASVVVSAAEKAESLELNTTTIKWIVGRSGNFKPTVTPSGASKTLKWASTNPKVATITQSGKLTAKAIGTTTVVCATTDGSNLKATCKVTIGKAVTSVKLNTASLNWIVGKSGTFKATVSPSDAINKLLTWTSSNTKVATITKDGKITATGVGTATITCKAQDGSGKYATCKVTVGKAVTSVKLNAATIKWIVGKTGSFKATVTPSDAMNKALTWTSSNPEVATITQSGKLTAKAIGTTTITCKTKDGSGKSATCKVTVGKAVTSVKLNTNTIKWPVGKSASFKATVTPSDAINKLLTWTSSNTKVATITKDGKLTAKAVGTATITCKAQDGSGKYATCKVSVMPRAKTLKLNAATIRWTEGKSGSFKPTITPENAIKTLSWTSSNPEVATISQSGKLTAVGVGTATITCKTTDGSNLTATCKVTVVKPAESAPNFSKVNKKYFSTGVFTIEGRMTTTNNGERIELPFKLAKDGTEHYVSAEYTYLGVTAELLVNNNKTYLVLPKLKSYQEINADVFGGAGFEGLTDTKEYVSTANVKIDNKTYVREGFTAKDGSMTYFYFLDGDLEIIKFKTSGGESNLYIDRIRTYVNEDDYKVPSNYKKIV